MAHPTPLQSRLMALARLCDRTNEAIGRYISWLTLAMVVVTFLIVILRYLFNLGWIGVQESVTYMHAFVFMLGAAYTLKHDGHVRVDIFYMKASKRTRAWVDLLGSLILLMPMMAFLFAISWDYVAVSWSLLEESPETGGLHGVYLLKSSMLALGGLMFLQGVALAIHNALFLMGVEAEPEHHTIAELK
jgi:TRAP-type mannitol/chloroaromatic compound transport system permease small subunit